MMSHLACVVVLISSSLSAAGRRNAGDCALGNLMEKVSCRYNKTAGNKTDCGFSFSIGNCMSCEPAACDVAEGKCMFEYEVNSSFNLNFKTGIMHSTFPLPKSCRELEERMCGAMNREGFLCSKCRPGYGPAPYSGTYKCFECNDNRSTLRWLLYIALELLPSTAFFVIVIFFNIRVTSPPCTAFVFVSQFFALLYKIQPFVRLSLKSTVNKVFLQGVLTLVSFWNLDFFRHVVPPFCISSKLTNLHSLFLDFISAFYPLFLVILTLSFIKLHAKNFRPLVIFWKPFHSCCAHCRRKIDSTSSVIAASATFVTLAFSKILVTTLLAIFPDTIFEDEKRALHDSHIPCNKSTDCYSGLLSIPYFFPLLIMLLVIHLPTFLLLLYPTKAFRRILVYCFSSKCHTIDVFIDTFQGHYKDGTDGSRDYRAASSISFLLKTLFCVILGSRHTRSGFPMRSNIYLSLIFLLTITSLFYGICQPCKKKYMNVVESVAYSAAVFILLTLGGHHLTHHTLFFSFFQQYLPLSILVLPSVILLILSIKKIFSCLCCFHKVHGDRTTLLSEQDLPDRMEHPYDYEPLN